MKVWILIVWLAASTNPRPVVIDGLISLEECERVAAVIQETNWVERKNLRCIEVLKATF